MCATQVSNDDDDSSTPRRAKDKDASSSVMSGRRGTATSSVTASPLRAGSPVVGAATRASSSPNASLSASGGVEELDKLLNERAALQVVTECRLVICV
jgi:hypothetical protein